MQEARTERETGAYGSRGKTVDEIRLSWRLVEAATGKLLRAGDLALDHVRPRPKAYARRDDFEAGALFAALARQLAADALARPAAASAPAPTAAEPAPALTPGSSEQPLRW